MTARRVKAARRPAIRRVAILGRVSRVAVGKRLGDLETWLRKQGLEVLRVHGEENASGLSWQPEFAGARAARGADLMITLGGDGTILAAARILFGTRVPILPINLGRLGFLASFEGHEVESAVASALAGTLQTETRRLLRAGLESPGTARPRPLGVALNDVVLKSEATYRALRLDVSAGDTFLGHVVADGLIAASPSGSTAYSLSAGGPVIAQGLDAIAVTPICPHTLGMRALVLPPSLELRVTVRSRDKAGAVASLDGLEGIPIGPADTIRIGLAPGGVRFLHAAGRTLPAALPAKLGWSASPRRSTD